MKAFVKGPGNADSYPELTVEFIRGRAPELVILDEADQEVERIDLSEMSTEEIHALMKAKGFERKVAGESAGDL